VPANARYCDQHKSKQRGKGEYPRTSDTNQTYDKAWREVRNLYLAHHQICELCGMRQASEVHHVIAVEDGGARLEESNLQALCKPCHSRLTIRSPRGFGRARRGSRVKVLE
jgi:5-methylcytosine-specific restriction protein A